MKRLLVAATLALVACGMPSGQPLVGSVSSTPLAGTLGGIPWRAVGGVASLKNAFNPDAGRRSLEISNKVIACGDFAAHSQVLGLVPWTVGSYELSLQQNLTFAVDVDGGIDNLVATNGRVEVLSAPGPDAGVATLRIRATFDSDNSVEGEVAITVCD